MTKSSTAPPMYTHSAHLRVVFFEQPASSAIRQFEIGDSGSEGLTWTPVAWLVILPERRVEEGSTACSAKCVSICTFVLVNASVFVPLY